MIMGMANRLKTVLLAAAVAGSGVIALVVPASGQTIGIATYSVSSPQALPAALRPALYRALAEDVGPAYQVNGDGCATLPKSPLKVCFSSRGAQFTGADTPLTLHLLGYGRGAKLTALTPVRPKIHGNWVNYRHGVLSE